MEEAASVQFFYGLTAKPATVKASRSPNRLKMGLMFIRFCFGSWESNLEGGSRFANKSPSRRSELSKPWCNLSSYMFSIERAFRQSSDKGIRRTVLCARLPSRPFLMYQDGVDPAGLEPAPLNLDRLMC